MMKLTILERLGQCITLAAFLCFTLVACSDAIDVFGAALTSYSQALAHDPENREARLGLAALYWNQFRDAESRRDLKDQRSYRNLVELYDDGTYATFLAGTGRLSLETAPPGCQVTLFR